MTGHLTPQQAATRSGVGRTTIMRALERDDIKAVRDNSGRWKISVEALEDWLSMRTVRSHDGQSPRSLSASDDGQELTTARIELATLRAELAGVRDRLTDAQADRDRLAALLERSLEPRPGLIERIVKLVRS
jgi:excisionase family DNA binding protein